MRPIRRVFVIPAVVGLLIGGVGVGTVVAAIPDAGTAVFHGCANKLTGVLRLVDPAKNQKCLTTGALAETAVTWNQQGPPGTIGAAGASGADGPRGEPGAAGRDGSSVLNGPGAPASDVGAVGDFYLDTTTPAPGGSTPALVMYGPKTASGWPAAGQALSAGSGEVPCPLAPLLEPITISPAGQRLFTGTTVDLAATASSLCPQGALFTYAWTVMSPPPGSRSVLASTTSRQTALYLDVPYATWKVSVVVTDQHGSSSAPRIIDVVSDPCGSFPPAPTVADRGDPGDSSRHLLVATVASLDNDPATCPARFVDTFAYDWTVLTAPPGAEPVLETPHGYATAMTATVRGVYHVQVTVTASNGRSASYVIPIVV